MDLRVPLAGLARWEPVATPVVSVYLNTRWIDEHQRERVRVFLKQRLREARETAAAAAADLDWIETQGHDLVQRVAFEDASGVALFACAAVGLREALPVRVAFEDTFIIAPRPFLRLLARAADATPDALVVFVDGAAARLIPLGPEGLEGEVVLDGGVEGRHATGGWAGLAQSRYRRHIEAQRDQHYQAVAEAIAAWGAERHGGRIVLAGETRAVAAVRRRLAGHLARRVVGAISGARREAASALAGRAADLLARAETRREEDDVDSSLAEAAESGPAVVGLDRVLEAVNQSAVRHLYVLESVREPGVACAACGALQRAFHFACAFCGRPTQTVELGEAAVERVVAAGGQVTTVERHAALAAAGGVVARLRHPEGGRHPRALS
jgi:Bacterial archaeo-eukaryotic release factor family 10